jgi:plasmid stabilization system protein ParE
MKSLAWVGVFVAIGVGAGTAGYALTPVRYGSVTTLQVTVVPHTRDEDLQWRSDRLLDAMLQNPFSEDWMERLMQEFGLYRREREAGRWADALLGLRSDITFSRRVESDISERWTVAFEADDPRVAEKVSSRLASFIAESFKDDGEEADESGAFILEILREQLLATTSEIETWRSTHGSQTPPAALMKQYGAQSAEYRDALRAVPSGPHRYRLFELHLEMVKTPRVSDGRIGPGLLQCSGSGAVVGLFIGLFTMPFFLRRQQA